MLSCSARSRSGAHISVRLLTARSAKSGCSAGVSSTTLELEAAQYRDNLHASSLVKDSFRSPRRLRAVELWRGNDSHFEDAVNALERVGCKFSRMIFPGGLQATKGWVIHRFSKSHGRFAWLRTDLSTYDPKERRRRRRLLVFRGADSPAIRGHWR